MKGRAPTAKQKRFHDLLCREIGCIACAKEGMFNSHVSVHHIDGRTKPLAHWLVLPVCGPHHQDAGIPGVVAIHPWKPRFEAKYGRQSELLRECIQILLDRGCDVPLGAWAAMPGMSPKTNPATLAGVPGLATASILGAAMNAQIIPRKGA